MSEGKGLRAKVKTFRRNLMQRMRERIKDRGGGSCGREKTKTGIRQGEVNMSQDMSMEKYIVGGSYSYGLYHHEYLQRD